MIKHKLNVIWTRLLNQAWCICSNLALHSNPFLRLTVLRTWASVSREQSEDFRESVYLDFTEYVWSNLQIDLAVQAVLTRNEGSVLYYFNFGNFIFSEADSPAIWDGLYVSKCHSNKFTLPVFNEEMACTTSEIWCRTGRSKTHMCANRFYGRLWTLLLNATIRWWTSVANPYQDEKRLFGSKTRGLGFQLNTCSIPYVLRDYSRFLT